MIARWLMCYVIVVYALSLVKMLVIGSVIDIENGAWFTYKNQFMYKRNCVHEKFVCGSWKPEEIHKKACQTRLDRSGQHLI